MNSRIGFIQGRLSPLIEGRIQAFPWPYWQEEFPLAAQNNLNLIEWTLDQDRLYENPLLTHEGQKEIISLCEKNKVAIPSLTGDCFMQAPFWKASGNERKKLQQDFNAIAEACSYVGISVMVIPLVDNGRLENTAQEDILVDFLEEQADFLSNLGLQVVFESDFAPSELLRFIDRLDPELFGINYDIGNSAAMAFEPKEEIDLYGHRIVNVHVKDRKIGDTTVPLGTGAAKFEAVFLGLAKVGYTGNYILQTARASDENHLEVLCQYRDITTDWIDRYGA